MVRALPQELEWIERILSGERDLFHDLIRPYERTVYMTAVSILRDTAEAEDAAQEAMLKAYRGLSSFRGDAKFSTWLTSITLNEARSRLRKAAKVRVESLDSTDHDEDFTPFLVADWREIPSETLEHEELLQHIEQAIQDLPPSYREVFLLRDKEEMSIEEIAQALGVKGNLVKVRLFRARMMLQKQLAPYLKRELPQRRRWFSWLGGRA
ncbi:MAG TPA: sigma-70 family RNA polymerase sigma factor [Acidobacteriaceae bacterium]|nr:sigma-70 family RNA polymerase sigma factor [Acidobacteriaceae bacterium]